MGIVKKMGGVGTCSQASIGMFLMCSLIEENIIFTLEGFICNIFYICESSVF
jgi:hypothetical protein